MKKRYLPIMAMFTVSLLSSCNSNPKAYKVTWLNDDGSVLEVDEAVSSKTHPTFDKDEPESKTTPPEGRFYTFAGWVDGNGIKYDDHYVLGEADISFKATYKAIIGLYEVSWLNDDGTSIDKTLVPYGDIPTHRTPVSTYTPSKGHHFVFDCWKDEEGTKLTDGYAMPAKSITFKAYFAEKKNEYSVYWMTDIGTLMDKGSVEYGEHPIHDAPSSKKTTPTGYHYSFVNWISHKGEPYSDGFLMPDEDVIFTPLFKEAANVYQIKWVDMFGTEIDSTYADYGEALSHPDPKKSPDEEKSEEYFFDGWYIGDEKIDFKTYKVEQDTTFVAKYQIFTLGGCTYSLNGDEQSYSASGIVEGYPFTDFAILDTYGGKPVTKIGDSSFNQLDFKKINFTIGKNVESIEPGAFSYDSIKSVTFKPGSKLKVIAHHSFFGIEDLVTFTAPSSLERIDSYAFGTVSCIERFDLSSLDHVVSLSGVPFFSTKFTIVVAKDMLDAYKAAWPEFASRIIAKN